MINKTGQDADWFSNINIEAGKKGLYDFSSGLEKKAQELPQTLNSNSEAEIAQQINKIQEEMRYITTPSEAWEIESEIPVQLLSDPNIEALRKQMWKEMFIPFPADTEDYFPSLRNLDMSFVYNDPEVIEKVTDVILNVLHDGSHTQTTGYEPQEALTLYYDSYEDILDEIVNNTGDIYSKIIQQPIVQESLKRVKEIFQSGQEYVRPEPTEKQKEDMRFIDQITEQLRPKTEKTLMEKWNDIQKKLK
jgi:5-formyltetrahydrofolate cyclo-ligase